MTRVALISLLLSGCSTVLKPADLPEPPAALRLCAAQAAVEIPQGPLTRAQTADLVAKIRSSELSKRDCAAAWSAWYEQLSA